MTLSDINQNLLDIASEKFRDIRQVDTISICTDVNQVELPRKKYDVVMCVSGLHHVQYPEPEVDGHLPDVDCSLDTFEGVRSEDIESVLSTRFSRFRALDLLASKCSGGNM